MTDTKKHALARARLRLRRGAFSAALSLCTALMVVCVSALADYLETKNGWRADLSFNAVATQGEATRAALKALEKDVHLYAVFSDGGQDMQLTEILARYAALSEHVSWSEENLTRNPLLLTMVSDEVDDASVTSDCLIVRCEETGRTRVLTGEDYVEYSYDADAGGYAITGWTYEKSLTEAILYVTMDELPKVQLLTGHGELSQTDTALMEEKLISANYAVTRVNLLSGDTLDANDPLMILSPLRDVTQGELAQLNAYAAAGGDLFVTVDYTDPDELPNLRAFYRAYGAQPIAGIVLADESDAGTYYESVGNLLPEMLYTEVTGTLKAAGYDLTLLSGARGFEMPGESTQDLVVAAALQSGETAYIRDYRKAGADAELSIARQADDRTGRFALALTADRGFADGTRSRAFFIGNSSMFLDDWMYTYTYSGEMLLQALQYLRGKAPVNLAIVPRQAARAPLAFSSAAVPALILAVPPMITLALALCALLPRKRL